MKLTPALLLILTAIVLGQPSSQPDLTYPALLDTMDNVNTIMTKAPGFFGSKAAIPIKRVAKSVKSEKFTARAPNAGCVTYHEYDNKIAEIDTKFDRLDSSLGKVTEILYKIQVQQKSHDDFLDILYKLVEILTPLIGIIAAIWKRKHISRVFSRVFNGNSVKENP